MPAPTHTIKSLFHRGYFAKEFPPLFSSLKAAQATVGLPNPFDDLTVPRPNLPWTSYATYSLPKAGGHRRVLQVPNPRSYLTLVQELVSGWDKIDAALSKNSLSKSRPCILEEGSIRAIAPGKKRSELITDRIKCGSVAKWILKFDIANFFPSIYTHSVPWGLHTRSLAGPGSDNTLLGNRLDHALRACQLGQTNGIAVGPDTSLVLAEIVLSQLDEFIQSHTSYLAGFRYYDDFELFFGSQSSAESFLADVEARLVGIQLSINSHKTSIVALPIPLQPSWLSTIRRYPLSRVASKQRRDLESAFSLAFDVSSRDPASSAINYLLTRLIGASIEPSNGLLLQELMCQCVTTNPTSMSVFSRLICYLADPDDGVEIDKDLIGNTLQGLIREGLLRGHSHEVVWAIWTMYALNIKLSRDLSRAMRDSQDTFLWCALIVMIEAGLCPQLAYKGVLNKMCGEEKALSKPRALVVYEAAARGLCDKKYIGTIRSDRFFSYLLDNDGRFLVDRVADVDLSKIADGSDGYDIDGSEEDDADDDQGVFDIENLDVLPF